MRALSPIIGVILLIMMTIAVMGAAYLWVTSLQQSVQQTSSQQMGTMQRGSINLLSADCNSNTGIVSIVVRNIGTVTIPKGNVTLEVKDANGQHLNILYDSVANNFAPNTLLHLKYNLSDTSESLEQKATTLTAESTYQLKISFPDGTSQAISCVAHN